MSWNYNTQAKADARALKECADKNSKNCSIVLRTDNNCASYAVDTSSGSTAYGWGKANNNLTAQKRALSECSKRGGNSCTTRVWGCDKVKVKQTQKQEYIKTKEIIKQKISSVSSSLLMLVDTSGSMKGEKLHSAKQAAKEAAKTSISAATEISILTFDGNCENPISRQLDFTQDLNDIYNFIDSLQEGGRTPLGNALQVANHFMAQNKSKSSRTHMILLLADGDDDCNNVASVMRKLKSKGIVFRHETVGLGIDSTSSAAQDLKNIASASGGKFHHTNDPKKLNSIFLEAISTMKMLDMLGEFGKRQTTQTNNTSNSDVTNSILDGF